MSLEIREHSREDIVILSLKGRITMEESDTLREAVQALIGAGHLRMLFDLTHVDYVDSTGLGGMVICYTSLKRLDGNLKLVNPNKRNIEMLALTRLHTIFEVFVDLQDAVNSFFPDRVIKRFDILAFVKAHAGDE
jgi:anti-sigma B factor antagonist